MAAIPSTPANQKTVAGIYTALKALYQQGTPLRSLVQQGLVQQIAAPGFNPADVADLLVGDLLNGVDPQMFVGGVALLLHLDGLLNTPDPNLGNVTPLFVAGEVVRTTGG